MSPVLWIPNRKHDQNCSCKPKLSSKVSLGDLQQAPHISNSDPFICSSSPSPPHHPLCSIISLSLFIFFSPRVSHFLQQILIPGKVSIEWNKIKSWTAVEGKRWPLLLPSGPSFIFQSLFLGSFLPSALLYSRSPVYPPAFQIVIIVIMIITVMGLVTVM